MFYQTDTQGWPKSYRPVVQQATLRGPTLPHRPLFPPAGAALLPGFVIKCYATLHLKRLVFWGVFRHRSLRKPPEVVE